VLNGFAVTGEPMRDQICLRVYNETLKEETSDTCSLPGQGIEFFSVWDYKHDQNLTLFDEMPFDGILGLGPATTEIEDRHSFTQYLFGTGLITNHTLTFRHLPESGNSKEIEFGHFGHSSALVRYHIEDVQEHLRTMRVDVSSVMFGNFTFPTHYGVNITDPVSTPEDPKWMRLNLIIGSDPFITYETPYIEELNDFIDYMATHYPEVKISQAKNRFNHTTILGSTAKSTCDRANMKHHLQNFTFNTSHEHQFHIPSTSMLFDTYMGYPLGQCILSILIVYDPTFTQKALIIGDPFFNNFNISLKYDTHIMGI
jgi:hypothetical protein